MGDKIKKLLDTRDFSDQYTQEDVNKNRVFGILSYIGILFLVGIFAAKDSAWRKFHSNQGLVLCIADVAGVVVLWLISFIFGLMTGISYIGWLFSVLYWITRIVLWLYTLATTGLMVFGIINAAKGKAKELPLIGKFRIIK